MTSAPQFLNSAIVTVPEWMVLKNGRWRSCRLAVRYGAFSHPIGGNCLIDTGYTERTTKGRRSLFLSAYAAILRPKLTADALPKARPDVDTILLTHMHADHVSGLRDYPRARIIARRDGVRSFVEGGAFYRIHHGVFSELLPDNLLARLVALEDLPVTDAPLGLGKGFDVFGDGSVLAVDLPGHMFGHVGYVWTRLDRPLLYAADAQWLMRAIREGRSPGPPAKWIMHDARAALDTARRIAAFAAAGGEVVLCHEPEGPR